VILPAFTFAAAAAVIRLTGATPVFVDPGTFCLDPDAVSAAVGPRTAAVMPVHLYGHPADMSALKVITRRHGLALIEDAAQAHGATWDGRPVGALGTAAGFSFYPTKNVFTIEGGMVATGDAALARKLRLLRNQGSQSRYVHEIVGTNARMSDVAAAIAREQLRRLPVLTAARRRNTASLDAALNGVVTTPAVAAAARHVYHQYTIRVPDAGPGGDQAADQLRAHGVATGVYYPTPLHRQAAFRCEADLPHTDAAARQVLSLPVYPGLTSTDLARITSAVTDLFTRERDDQRPATRGTHRPGPHGTPLTRPATPTTPPSAPRSWQTWTICSASASTTSSWPAPPACTNNSGSRWPRPGFRP
jgi:dTDP-4-amino-4,6-dideoxygalactose transaminase